MCLQTSQMNPSMTKRSTSSATDVQTGRTDQTYVVVLGSGSAGIGTGAVAKVLFVHIGTAVHMVAQTKDSSSPPLP